MMLLLKHTYLKVLKEPEDAKPILSNKCLPNCPSKVARTSNEFVHKFRTGCEEPFLAPESFLLKCRRHKDRLGQNGGLEMEQKA
jgi:hypothetical protein